MPKILFKKGFAARAFYSDQTAIEKSLGLAAAAVATPALFALKAKASNAWAARKQQAKKQDNFHFPTRFFEKTDDDLDPLPPRMETKIKTKVGNKTVHITSKSNKIGFEVPNLQISYQALRTHVAQQAFEGLRDEIIEALVN